MPINNSELKHGTISCYNVDKCRCELCRACKAIYAKRSRNNHPNYAKEHYAKNADYYKQWAANWRKTHGKENSLKAQKWNRKNRERYNERMRLWRQDNPDKVHRTNKINQAKRKKAKVFKVTVKDWKKLLNQYNFCCFYCKDKGEMTMDHIIPISRGGNHSIGNIIPACKSCNSKKNKRFIMEWRLACR